MTHSSDTHQAITHWLEAMVIGLNLCPFARAPYQEGRVEITVSEARDFDEAMEDVLDALDALLALDAETRSTTLFVTPHALHDFDEFLDAIDALEHILEESGAHQLVQLAHFHPDYLFEGVASDDASHYTNRAPHPIIHLLRVEEVADAIASMPGVHEIPARNTSKMREVGHAALIAMMQGGDKV